MRCNWLRVALCAAAAFALGCGSLAQPAAAAGNDEFAYVHDTQGFIYITHLDERDGGLLPVGIVQIAPTGPNCAFDCQTLAYSRKAHMLVVANGNGGAGNGSLSTARVQLDGRLTPLLTTTVPGSGDLTGVFVHDTKLGTFVYATDPTNNQVFAFSLGANGALTPTGAPQPAGMKPMGLSATAGLLFVVNADSVDISIYRIQPVTGALTPVGATVPITGAASPRLIFAEGNLVYVADCNPAGTVTAAGGSFFAFRLTRTSLLRPDGNSPFTTADASICSFAIDHQRLAVIGTHPATTIQTGILKKGVPNGNGGVFKLRTAYEIGRFDRSDGRYLVIARSGDDGIIRSLRIGGGLGHITSIQNGVAPLPTGQGSVNGMTVVDP
jgi:Lactonase, 7-bladed beta-propeller